MKKRQGNIFICFWGSLLFLSACSLHTPQEKAAVCDTVKQGCEEYAAVLLEDAVFFDAMAQEYRHVSDYMPPLFRHRMLNTSDFCLSDIDNDGVNEVFLQYAVWILIFQSRKRWRRNGQAAGKKKAMHGKPFTEF